MALRTDVPLRVFHPIWPEQGGIDPAQVAVGYDRLSDTLYVDLYGAPRPAVSVPEAAASEIVTVYLRVDPDSEEVVGLQIEGVAATAGHPDWLRGAMALVPPADGAGSQPNGDAATKQRVVAAIFGALAPRTA